MSHQRHTLLVTWALLAFVAWGCSNSSSDPPPVTSASPSPSPSGSAPTAAFATNPTPASGFSPLAIGFVDQSTNNPTGRTWDFGDGTTSTAQNPSHTYTATGAYTVRLTATNAAGSNQIVSINHVAVTDVNAGSPFYFVNDAFGNPVKTNNGSEAALAQQVLTLFNQERAAIGKPALIYDAAAERPAKAHAEDMVARNFFAHNSPEGFSPTDRLVFTQVTGFSGFAENLALGQPDPATAVSDWMASTAGHREAILGISPSPDTTHVGIGVSTNPGGGFMWVAVFLLRP